MAPARPRARRRASSFVAFGLLALAAACGSKTGLFVPDTSSALTPDAAVDASIPPPDAEPDADTPVPCVPGRFGMEVATAQLMFVVDRSGSMALTLDGEEDIPPGQKSRWQVLRDGLEQTIVPFDDEIAMGAKFFPEALTPFDALNPALACESKQGVGISPARGNAPAILGVFDATEPRGGTPTSEALRFAAEHLVARRAVARTIVLATDGAPNCNTDIPSAGCVCTAGSGNCTGNPGSCLDDVRTIATIRDIADKQKVPVYVIGIGSTNSPEFLRTLDRMAVAGGRPRVTTPRHYSAQTPAELTSALASIRDGVARCTFLTPSAPTDPDAIEVEIGGAPVPRDPSRSDGWDWVDQTYGALAFFGEACEAARANGAVFGVVRCE